MEVILKQDVDSLGQKGEVIRVAPGYARNFLIPRDLAVAATAGNMRNLRDFIASAEKKRVAERDEAQKLADKIAALTIKIEARAGDKNRLFGSVTGQDIADVVNAALDLSIDKKKINTAGGIKTLGKHAVKITVYPGVVVDTEVEVTAVKGAAGKLTPEEVAEMAANETPELLEPAEAAVVAEAAVEVAEAEPAALDEDMQESQESADVAVEEAVDDISKDPTVPHAT